MTSSLVIRIFANDRRVKALSRLVNEKETGSDNVAFVMCHDYCSGEAENVKTVNARLFISRINTYSMILFSFDVNVSGCD